MPFDTDEWWRNQMSQIGFETGTSKVEEVNTELMKPWHVILLDDDYHTFEYIISMLGAIFGHSKSKAREMANHVNSNGEVIVHTCSREEAELRREQIHGFGADVLMGSSSSGSMGARIEVAS